MDTDAVLTMMQEVADEVINPRFRDLSEGQVREKNPGDLVTVADTEAEALITRRLHEAFPDAVVVGEEATAGNPALLTGLDALDHWFTVDPIDGTKNFVHGSADHAVMIAQMRGGDPVRSWIWQPAHQVAYVSERGAGAYRDGVRLAPPTPNSPPRGVTSKRPLVGEQVGDLEPLQLSWVCCGVDYPKIADAVADFIVYESVMPWDHAPGALLLHEVGGVVTHRDGTPYRPAAVTGGLLAADTAAVHAKVLPLLDR